MQRMVALAASHAFVGAAAYAVGYRNGTNAQQSLEAAKEFEHQATREQEEKAELLDYLRHRAYVKLGSSAVAGVGVFALIDIPPGVDPFEAPNLHLRGSEESVRLSADELQSCPSAVVDHILDFHDTQHAHNINGRMYPPFVKVNARATVSMDASWYLNHGEAANVKIDTTSGTGGDAFFPYKTTRRVRAGEELFLDYRDALPGVYAQIQVQRERERLDVKNGSR